MKFKRESSGNSGLTSASASLAGSFLIGLLALTLVAGPGAADGPGTGGKGDFSGDNEAVGTLPGPTGGGMGSRQLEGVERPDLQDRPSFYLQGPAGTVLPLVPTQCVSQVSVEFPGGGNGADPIVRIVFHGELNLVFDARLFHRPGVTAGVKVGACYGDVAAAVLHQNRVIVRRNLPAESTFPVPLYALLRRGTLQDGVQLVMAGQDSHRNTIEIDDYVGLVRVRQR